MTTIAQNNRIAKIIENAYGEFQTFIGFKDEDRANGMQVIDAKSYKNQKTAIKFCEKWVNA